MSGDTLTRIKSSALSLGCCPEMVAGVLCCWPLEPTNLVGVDKCPKCHSVTNKDQIPYVKGGVK